MKILLDTHILLWYLEADDRMSQQRRAVIEDDQNQKFLSIVSLWEVAIKRSIGKLSIQVPLSQLYPKPIILLPLEIPHMEEVENLPLHHRDPFDRLLIAQAITEGLVVMTEDKQFAPYPIRIV